MTILNNDPHTIDTVAYLRELKEKAEEAEWSRPPHPNAARLRREYEQVKAYLEGGHKRYPLF